jgi:hypothetical protein
VYILASKMKEKNPRIGGRYATKIFSFYQAKECGGEGRGLLKVKFIGRKAKK